MNKTEFVAEFAKELGTTKKESKEIVDRFIKVAKEAIINSGDLDLSGFIKIEKVHKDAKKCMNLQTGKPMMSKEKDVPKAKFSARFKREVENGEIEE